MKLRVILIDGDPETEASFAACLATRSHALEAEIAFAPSDAEALGLLHSDRAFDIALVSVDDGPTSGLAVFQRLMEPSLRIPRVALTDGRDIERIRQAIADGASDFLVKPLRAEDVVATLARVVEKVERRRRNWRDRSTFSALRREVEIAADLQRLVLPSRFPDQPEFDIHASMRPAQGIGGDFYDVFTIDPDRMGFLIADVSGKGIPAAFYMAIASTALRTVALTGAPPARCLGQVNDILAGRDIPGMFVSVFYGVADTREWRIRCANAGHLPPLIKDAPDAASREFECGGGPVMGIARGQAYDESELAIAPGSTLLLYTDGVTEAYDPDRNAFGHERLADTVSRADGGTSADIVGAIDAELARFVDRAEQHDDITVLAIKRIA
jgi:phosphoserine phosphatase RsbU/P